MTCSSPPGPGCNSWALTSDAHFPLNCALACPSPLGFRFILHKMTRHIISADLVSLAFPPSCRCFSTIDITVHHYSPLTLGSISVLSCVTRLLTHLDSEALDTHLYIWHPVRSAPPSPEHWRRFRPASNINSTRLPFYSSLLLRPRLPTVACTRTQPTR